MDDFDLGGAPAATRVVVAMSGGVDSSVCAALLKQAGYDAVGITLQLYDQGAARGRPGSCCAGADIADARRVADRLDMPHYVLDYEERFRRAVIDDFVATYRAGATPIPCVRCNQKIKFGDLLGVARDLGARALVTGHYARRVVGPGGAELHRAADEARDQSYFLFATTRDELDFVRFPLGPLPKSAVRDLAARFDLPVAAKPDSQDICFVPSGHYARTIERLHPGASEEGEIVDLAGRVVGRHAGIIHFTVGQRRGLGHIGGGEPLYVVRIEAASRRVVVGAKAALLSERLRIEGCNWLCEDAVGPGAEVTIKLRSSQAAVRARLYPSGADAAEVELAAPQAAIAPGQAGVIYAGERCLGGGWIAGPAAAAEAA